ncbi:nucleus protein [Gigaspora margarita]|uniref:Nucleus protein n=1 Tax=Gigaspora margarita TaxID=4874 RepID=A0A8H4A2L6_GIGMA|nr:nucleus protein [Gigaspora margarita]
MSLFILDDMIVDESGDSHKRVKITTACDTCRRRKVKCDGASPCANCQRGGYQCTFSDSSSKRPRGPPKGFVALIEDRLHTIESLLVNLVNKDNTNELNKEIKRERETTIEETTTSTRQRFSTFKIRHYSPSNSITTTNSLHHLFIPSTPPADMTGFSESPTLVASHSDELASDDEDILHQNLVSPNDANSLQSSTLSFLINSNQPTGASYVDPPLPTSIPQLNKALSPDVAQLLLEKYFNHFHPYFPIINRAKFVRHLSNPNVEDQPSPLLLNAIYAVGALFPPELPDSYSPKTFYDRARNMLDYFIDAPRLSTVQALILLCMVDQGKPTSYRPQTYSSMAIRMAQSMGLNRRNGPVYQGKGRQTKKLVWWGCFIVDRLNSLATGDPLSINDRMCDIELPSPDEVDDQDDGQQQSPQQQNSHSSTYAQQINIFVNFIRLARLIGQIIEHLQSTSCMGISSSWTHHLMISNFENLLWTWHRELPHYLHYAPSPQHMPLPGHIASIHMHQQALFLVLHYPYIANNNTRQPNSRMSKSYHKSLTACTSAANTITHIGVEALNNINVCITFPTMFHCLAKAAKVHEINIASSQRVLAIPAYKNIVKTIKICHFYQENNIMTELAGQTIKALNNILMKYQKKFSNEDISSSNSSNIPTHIKISPTINNQSYGESSTPTIDRTSSTHSIIPYVGYTSSPTSTNADTKRGSSSPTNMQSTQNFTYSSQPEGTGAQFIPINIGNNQIFDQFATMQMQSPTVMSPAVATDMSSTELWELGMNFGTQPGIVGFNNNSYNQMTVTGSLAPSTTTTPSLPPSTSASPTDYFTSQQIQQRQRQPTPTTTSSPFKSHTRSNTMALDSIEHESEAGTTMLTEPMRNVGIQNVHNSQQRYVIMDTNDNNPSIDNHINNGFVVEGSGVYGRMSSSNKTHPRIFNKIPQRLMKKEDINHYTDYPSNNDQSSMSNANAINVLSRRSSGSHCGGFKFGNSVNYLEVTSVGIGHGDDYEQYDGI